jgi:hypothetical protein
MEAKATEKTLLVLHDARCDAEAVAGLAKEVEEWKQLADQTGGDVGLPLCRTFRDSGWHQGP